MSSDKLIALQEKLKSLADSETDEQKIERLREENAFLWSTAKQFREQNRLYRQKVTELQHALSIEVGESFEQAQGKITAFMMDVIQKHRKD